MSFHTCQSAAMQHNRLLDDGVIGTEVQADPILLAQQGNIAVTTYLFYEGAVLWENNFSK